MSIKFVTLQTFTKIDDITEDKRNVTIAYSPARDEFSLLGNLPHATRLVINQKLVNDLQQLLDEIEKECSK